MDRSIVGSRRMVRLAAVIAVTLGLSSCASSDPSANGAATASTSSAGISDADIQLASSFVGGTPGSADPSLPPIKIGLVANVSGPVAQPYLATAAEDAAAFVNDELGGVAGGHPLEFVRCTFGGSAEEGQLCGQQFANDPSIAFVFFPGGTVGGPQLHAANNGAKAYLCTVASPGDASVDNLFCTSGGSLGAGSMITYLADYVHARTVSLISIDDPTLAAISQQVASLFAPTGIDVTVSLAPAGASDVTSTVLGSGAQTADASLLLLPTAASCIPFVEAFEALAITTPVVALQQCSEPSVVQATGDVPPFTFYDYGPSVNLPDPEMDVFRHVTAEYGAADGATAPQVFGDGLLVARIINELGTEGLSTPAVSSALASFTGPAFLGDDTLSFGNQPFTSVGSLRARFFTYLGDGNWEDATDGAWLSGPS